MLTTIATCLLAFHASPIARAPGAVTHMHQQRAQPAMGPFDFLAFGQAAASHILLSDGGKANYIKGLIESGDISFEAAAKEYSTCPSAAKGGDLGAFPRGAMVGPFDSYCYDPDTVVGEIGVVRTNFGTHLVKLTKKPSFAKVVLRCCL